MQFTKTILVALFLLVFSTLVKADMQNINIVCDAWPPYQTVYGDHVDGFSSKVVKTVFDRMNIRISNVSSFPWKRAMKMMKEGRADALFSSNYTKDRTLFSHYPDEKITDAPWVMWVREGSGLSYKSVEDLKGKRVGLVLGYSYTPEFLAYVEKHNNYELVASDEQNFKKLNANRLDYIVAELENGRHIINLLGLEGIKPLLKNPIKIDGLYIIFNKKRVSKEFVDDFSEELRLLKQEPLYEIFRETYFGEF